LAYLLYIISGSFKKLNETKLIQRRIEDRSQIKSRIEARLNQRSHIKSRITIKSRNGAK